jgi:hypothetical protein
MGETAGLEWLMRPCGAAVEIAEFFVSDRRFNLPQTHGPSIQSFCFANNVKRLGLHAASGSNNK